jgi:hypothetical protein
MAGRRLRKEEEFPYFYEEADEAGVTVTLPAEDDDGSGCTTDEAMFLIADETIRAAEKQLRLDRASGWNEPAPAPEPSQVWWSPGGKLCVECFSAYPIEAQVRCCACGGSVCPECSVELEELDSVLCPACLRTNAEEA